MAKTSPDEQRPAGNQPPVAAETPPVATPATDTAAAALLAAGGAAPETGTTTRPLPEAPIDEVGVRFREGTAREAVIDRVDASLDRRGEPTSAELRPEPVFGDDALRLRRDRRDALLDAPLGLSGVLPATTRVLASGEEVPIAKRTEDGTTRLFQTTVRTLRGDTIYDAGADIPLTRTEFESKRAMKAIVEQYFDEGG